MARAMSKLVMFWALLAMWLTVPLQLQATTCTGETVRFFALSFLYRWEDLPPPA
jgi:hypothetical protein